MSTYPPKNATTGAATNGTNPSQGASHGPSEEDLLTEAITLQVTWFIFGVLGLIILFRLPSLFNFLRSRYGRPFLQVFGSGPSSGSAQTRNVFNGGQRSVSRMSSFESYASAEKKGSSFATPPAPVALNLRGGPIDKSKLPPRHFSCVPSILDRVVNLLRVRVMPGYTLGQFLILSNYTYVMLYGTFRMSNPFTDGLRPGWLAVCQMPLLFALAQKSSILGSLLGCGYEALNYIHRYIGRLVVLASNIHSLYYIYKWTANGTFLPKIVIPKFAWGLAFLIATDVLFFFSLEYFRRKTYQLFFWTHTIGSVAAIVGGILHFPALIPWMAACAALYGLDRLLRAFKSSVAVATLTHLPQMDMAYLEVPTIKSGWRAGQHVRLRVLSTALGPFGWTESHPLTISSASGANDGLVLLCKKAGDWSSKLVDLAKELDAQGGEGQGKVKVHIEGPFGGSRMVFTSFSAAVLVVGGSGITFGLSMMEELLVRDRNNESRLRYLELVWSVQDPASVTPLLPLFQSLVKQTNNTMLKITVNYTRALTEKTPVFGSYEVVPCTPMAIAHPNLTLSPGRPNIKNILSGAIDSVVKYNTGIGAGDSLGLSGLAVGICGPQSLGDSVTRAIGGIDSVARASIGGIEVHEETFNM